MEEKILDMDYRKEIIAEIKGNENVQRKIVSYKKWRMQQDDFYHYVKEHLESKLDADTVSEMTIYADINLQRRISKNEASIYKYAPDRKFENDDFAKIYKQMEVNKMLRRSNETYKYQGQCALQLVPTNGELIPRVLLPHHYDVINFPNDPEKAWCYVLSSFDNTTRDKVRREPDRVGHSQGETYRNLNNENIADADDAKLKYERYVFWTKSYNLVCNGHGELIDKVSGEETEEMEGNIESPLADEQVLPFIDIANQKDFEFWVRGSSALYDGTIKYNVILTNEHFTVELQGKAVAFYKGSAEHMPENMRVGVNKVIFIPVDPNNPVDSQFGFVNPGSDLSAIKEFRESYLAAFLSSRGLDISVVSGRGDIQKASSGIEKLLQMIEKFEASLEDFSLFQKVEEQLYRITHAWLKQGTATSRQSGDPLLNENYRISLGDYKQDQFSIEFHEPQAIQTKMDELNELEKEIDLGISSRVHYLMEKGMSKEQAIERIKEVEEFEFGTKENQSDRQEDRTDV